MYTLLLCTSVGLLAHNKALKSTDGIRSFELPSLSVYFVCFLFFFNPINLRHVIITADEAAFITK